MNVKQLKKLPVGLQVGWRGDPKARGAIQEDATGRYIAWSDGQRTDGRDDWALELVYVLTAEQEAKR